MMILMMWRPFGRHRSWGCTGSRQGKVRRSMWKWAEHVYFVSPWFWWSFSEKELHMGASLSLFRFDSYGHLVKMSLTVHNAHGEVSYISSFCWSWRPLTEASACAGECLFAHPCVLLFVVFTVDLRWVQAIVGLIALISCVFFSHLTMMTPDWSKCSNWKTTTKQRSLCRRNISINVNQCLKKLLESPLRKKNIHIFTHIYGGSVKEQKNQVSTYNFESNSNSKISLNLNSKLPVKVQLLPKSQLSRDPNSKSYLS